MSNKNQGEGNREANKRYVEDTKDFVESGGVEKNKDKHTDLSFEEREKLKKAAEEGKDKAKS